MLTLDEATQRLLGRAEMTAAEPVALIDALGRTLVTPLVTALGNVPPFANSSMDGFAVRAADTPGKLRVVGDSAAGAASPPRVKPGTAVAIATGAPMPPGADAVVPVEQVEERNGTITVAERITDEAYVRAAGHDTAAGDEVFLPGELTPAKIATLASLGIARVEVRRRPRIAIVSTGDELVDPGAPLGPGQIHDANSIALAAAVADAGGQPLDPVRVPDDLAATETALARAAATANLVVTSGGVSVGRRDYVRAVLEREGRIDFWRIAVQPGKPLAVGELGGTTVIGLPGNPVSALVTFELFVRPFIRAMLDLDGDGRTRVRAVLAERVSKDTSRRAFLRVTLWAREDGAIEATPSGGQQSSQLRPMADANGLLVVPEGREAGERGHTYEAIVLGPIPVTRR